MQSGCTDLCGIFSRSCQQNPCHMQGSPPLPNASQEELDALHAWRDDNRQEVTSWNTHIKIASDVDAKLSADIFNKETEASSWRGLPNWHPPAPCCSTVPLHQRPTAPDHFRAGQSKLPIIMAFETTNPYDVTHCN
jgi:hypothetical protein